MAAQRIWGSYPPPTQLLPLYSDEGHCTYDYSQRKQIPQNLSVRFLFELTGVPGRSFQTKKAQGFHSLGRAVSTPASLRNLFADQYLEAMLHPNEKPVER